MGAGLVASLVKPTGSSLSAPGGAQTNPSAPPDRSLGLREGPEPCSLARGPLTSFA